MNIEGKQNYLKEIKKKNVGKQKHIWRKAKGKLLNESNKKYLKDSKEHLKESKKKIFEGKQ